MILGHEIVGEVEGFGSAVEGFRLGQRVGVPWLGHTCGTCDYCRNGSENLCDHPGFTGYTLPGGYAEYTVADARYCFSLPDHLDDVAAAPLMCAGLIGFRAYRFAPDAQRLGFYGFGAAAHILTQLAVHEGRGVYAFTRPGDVETQAFARRLGACWAGGSDESPPEQLDAAILFAPAGPLVPAALEQVRKGGSVVCAGIHMSDIPSFPYRALWEERKILSVANLTRQDGVDFFARLSGVPLKMETTTYALRDANQALDDLRYGRFNGAAVLRI